MPIGKNAIKRVENNGYSKVKTDAPDMENSTVVAEKKAPAKKAPAKVAKPAEKKAPAKAAKPAEKKAPAKAVKPAEKKTPAKAEGKNGFDYVNFGKELPVYLL